MSRRRVTDTPLHSVREGSALADESDWEVVYDDEDDSSWVFVDQDHKPSAKAARSSHTNVNARRSMNGSGSRTSLIPSDPNYENDRRRRMADGPPGNPLLKAGKKAMRMFGYGGQLTEDGSEELGFAATSRKAACKHREHREEYERRMAMGMDAGSTAEEIDEAGVKAFAHGDRSPRAVDAENKRRARRAVELGVSSSERLGTRRPISGVCIDHKPVTGIQPWIPSLNGPVERADDDKHATVNSPRRSVSAASQSLGKSAISSAISDSDDNRDDKEDTYIFKAPLINSVAQGSHIHRKKVPASESNDEKGTQPAKLFSDLIERFGSTSNTVSKGMSEREREELGMDHSDDEFDVSEPYPAPAAPALRENAVDQFGKVMKADATRSSEFRNAVRNVAGGLASEDEKRGLQMEYQDLKFQAQAAENEDEGGGDDDDDDDDDQGEFHDAKEDQRNEEEKIPNLSDGEDEQAKN